MRRLLLLVLRILLLTSVAMRTEDWCWRNERSFAWLARRVLLVGWERGQEMADRILRMRSFDSILNFSISSWKLWMQVEALDQRKHLRGTDTIHGYVDDAAYPYLVDSLPIGGSGVFEIQPNLGSQHHISSVAGTPRRTRYEIGIDLDSAIVHPLPRWSRVLPVLISFHVLGGYISQTRL